MSDSYGTQRWVSFYNDSGLVIPSYALVMLVSDKGATSSTKNFCKRLRARQYTTSGSDQFIDRGVYAFNSRQPVQPETYGKCNFAVDGPAWARIKDVDVSGTDLNEDTDWLGKEYGPINEKWSIGPDGSGYALLSRPKQLDGASYHRVLVMKKPAAGVELLGYFPANGIGATVKFLGSRNSGGVEYEGVGLRVLKFNDTTHVPEVISSTESTIYARNCDGLLVPGRYYECVRQGEVWRPCGGGMIKFSSAVTLDDIPNSGTGTVRVYLGDSSAYPHVDVEAECPISHEAIPEQTDVTVFWDAEREVMQIDGIACPGQSVADG